MNIVSWLKSRFSIRAKALACYRRGVARAHGQDYQGALDDYGATLTMENAPSDVKAMAYSTEPYSTQPMLRRRRPRKI